MSDHSPEERVRQKLLSYMQKELGFPGSLIAVEKAIANLHRRIDVLCYYKRQDGALAPLLLIECKRGRVDEKAAAQVMGYNSHVGAPFIALVGDEDLAFADVREVKKQIHFKPVIPSYQELIELL